MEEWDLRKRTLFAWLAAGVVAALLPIPAAAAPSVTTIATGLDSPRGVAFFHGKLLVGEAGHGGPTCSRFRGFRSRDAPVTARGSHGSTRPPVRTPRWSRVCSRSAWDPRACWA